MYYMAIICCRMVSLSLYQFPIKTLVSELSLNFYVGFNIAKFTAVVMLLGFKMCIHGKESLYWQKQKTWYLRQPETRSAGYISKVL